MSIKPDNFAKPWVGNDALTNKMRVASAAEMCDSLGGWADWVVPAAATPHVLGDMVVVTGIGTSTASAAESVEQQVRWHIKRPQRPSVQLLCGQGNLLAQWPRRGTLNFEHAVARTD